MDKCSECNEYCEELLPSDVDAYELICCICNNVKPCVECLGRNL